MPSYAIVIVHPDAGWADKPADEQRQILAQYFAWHDGLVEAGAFETSVALKEDRGRRYRVVDGEVVDGPFTEAKEIVGGFFLVHAADLEAATALAKGCPALDFGGHVQVREVGQFERP